MDIGHKRKHATKQRKDCQLSIPKSIAIPSTPQIPPAHDSVALNARTHLATSTPTLALVPILLACSLTLALASKLTTFDSDLVDFDLVATVPVDERVVGVLRRRRRD
jgi:hypothetical protein